MTSKIRAHLLGATCFFCPLSIFGATACQKESSVATQGTAHEWAVFFINYPETRPRYGRLRVRDLTSCGIHPEYLR